MSEWFPTCHMRTFDNTPKLTNPRLQQMWKQESGAATEWRDVPLVHHPFTEESCPGHIASDDPKVCRRCGVHIDSFRPDDGVDGETMPDPMKSRAEGVKN